MRAGDDDSSFAGDGRTRCAGASGTDRSTPVLTIASGDTVTIDTLSGEPQDIPEPAAGLTVLRRPSRGARQRSRRPGPALPHGSHRGRRRQARRRAGGSHPKDRMAPGLGLEPAGAAARHAAGGFPRIAPHPHPARSRAQHGADAVGTGARPRAVLRQFRRGAAAAVGATVVEGAARIRRQHGQQGARRRHHGLFPGVRRKARCSRRATAMPSRATARSA